MKFQAWYKIKNSDIFWREKCWGFSETSPDLAAQADGEATGENSGNLFINRYQVINSKSLIAPQLSGNVSCTKGQLHMKISNPSFVVAELSEETVNALIFHALSGSASRFWGLWPLTCWFWLLLISNIQWRKPTAIMMTRSEGFHRGTCWQTTFSVPVWTCTVFLSYIVKALVP